MSDNMSDMSGATDTIKIRKNMCFILKSYLMLIYNGKKFLSTISEELQETDKIESKVLPHLDGDD